MTNAQETQSQGILVSKKGRSLILLIIATIIVSMLAGVLGAFKSGKFYKTYDYIEVNIPYDQVDYSDPVFEYKSKASREIIKYEKEYTYDIVTGEEIIKKIKMYKGYYINYFFKSYWFYVDTVLNSLMVMIFYIALVHFLIVRRSEKNKVHQRLEAEINELIIEDNSLPPTSFEPWLEKWNNKRKINQHIANIKYELSILEKKTPYKIKKVFHTKIDNQIIFEIPKDVELEKEHIKYLEKKEELESFLEPSYINNHVVFEKVKHFRTIYASFVTTGKNDIVKSTDEYSNIKNNREKQTEDYTIKALMGFILSFAIGIALSFVLFRIDDHWLVVLFAVILKLLPLSLQVILANDYSNRYIDYQAIPNLRYRLNIASMYLADSKEVT